MKTTLGMVLAIVLLWLANYMIFHANLKMRTGVASAHDKKIMRYHGTDCMMEGFDGRKWFIRNGKRVFIKT